MSRPLVALSLLAFAFAAGCRDISHVPVDKNHKDVEVGEDAAIQEWVGNLGEGWRAVLTAVQATSAAYEFIVDAPTSSLRTPEGLKEAGDRIELARDAVRRLESFGVQPPTGIALGYREYFTTSGPFVPGRRYYSSLLSEADLTRAGFKVVVRFDESLSFASHGMISDSTELYGSKDGAITFFSTRRRIVAHTKGYLGGRRSFLACIEFIDPFQKIAMPAKNTSVEDLIRELKS